MFNSLLVKIFGFPATLVHGDTCVLDRFLWLKRHLPPTKDKLKFLDAGCGSGAFTLYAAKRGYQALGLSWDEANQTKAANRAKICKLPNAKFEIKDIRSLEECTDFYNQYDIVISFENIEHIINDLKLIKDLANCLKPGGFLLLTAPYYYYHAFADSHNGPFLKPEEDGDHMRRGYTPAMLKELCNVAGLELDEISHCSGFLSQKLSGLYSKLQKINKLIAWIIILPLRIFPPIFDRFFNWLLCYPNYSICMTAYKPRHNKSKE